MDVQNRALEEFFQFLQCQLRMEAAECLQEELDTDPEANKWWQNFRSWVQPNLGKKEKWMPFHTVLGAHELFIVENIHHGTLPWDEKRKFIAMFVFRAHCRSNVFREAQLPHMLQEDFWRDPIAQFADNGAVTRALLEYRRRTRQALQTSAFLAIPERLCQDDDENLARNVAMRTRTLLEVAEKVWPLVHDQKLVGSEKFQEISKTIQAGRRLGETWAKMLMVSIDIAYPKLQLLASTCDVGVGALKALQRLFPGSLEPREALVRATRAANCARLPAASNFWGLLAKVESRLQTRFSGMPRVLDQVSTPPGHLSAVTIQVQLCEWRQFMDFLSRAGVSSIPALSEAAESEVLSEPTKKFRRITGKRPDSVQETGGAADQEPADSEDEMPLTNIRVPPMAGQVLAEGTFIQATVKVLETCRAKVASTHQAVEAARAQLLRCDAAQRQATSQVVEALRRNSAAEEAVRCIEMQTSQQEYMLQASHMKTEVTKEVLCQLEDAHEKLSKADSSDVAKELGLPLLKESTCLENAMKSRIGHLEGLIDDLGNQAHADEVAREPQEEQHAELIRQSSVALEERGKAREAVTAAMEVLRQAQQHGATAGQELAQLRLQLHLEEAKVLSLQQLVRQEAWRLLVRFGVSQVRVHSQ
ncbi:unnamed protein product [Effrenium voratum]|nr:unnamed protein product [Effrenium voratum]